MVFERFEFLVPGMLSPIVWWRSKRLDAKGRTILYYVYVFCWLHKDMSMADVKCTSDVNAYLALGAKLYGLTGDGRPFADLSDTGWARQS